MGSDHTRLCRIILVLVLGGVLTACGGKPMAFPTPESEMPDRPGLLTGQSGVWTVYEK